MTEKSLKSQATKGMLWSAVEKILLRFGQFAIHIILARLLLPKDFGLIGMLTIFIVLSQIFVDSGMESGLIQKQKRTDRDFSTVLIFNFGISVLFYFFLFLFAPFIAEFYSKPELTMLTRVLGLNVIINSLAVVQRTIFKIELDFKTLAKVNVLSIIVSGVVAILSAYYGAGVWALVIQNLLQATITTIMFWVFSKWKLSIHFSRDSFKHLFGFGSKLLLAGLYSKSLQEVYNVVIGKFYNASELGFYYNGKKLTEVLTGIVSSVIQQVSYPILASVQDDIKRMINIYGQTLRMTAFLIIPSMTLLALLADPLIRLLLTDEWVPVIVLLQWLSIATMFRPISVINMNILNAIGRSDLFLKTDLSKLPFIVIALIITVPIGVEAIVIGSLIISLISFFINAYMPGKLFGYGAFKQLRDMIPVFFATGFMALFVYFGTYWINSYILKIMAGSILGIFTYLLLCHVLKIQELREIYNIVNNFRNKRKD